VQPSRRGFLLGLGAAVSFGVSAPLSKRLLDDVSPELLAGLLYLGALFALLALRPLRARARGRGGREARLQRADVPRLAGLVVAGGIVAPVLLLLGLERTTGSAGSLLLNLEGPLTAIVAIVWFREHLSRHAFGGTVLIFAAAVALSWSMPGTSRDLTGALFIAAACALWAVDNNLTQSLTLRDPVSVVTVKATAASVVNISLACVIGARAPAAGAVVGALVVGAIAYGLSIVLDAYALRLLGAAREAAIFATAPFVGAAVAVPLLDETLGWRAGCAAIVMAVGVALMLTERHSHVHEHEPMVHDHVHVHDEHHQHEHAPGVDANQPHSHPHRHGRLVHAHAHVSDVHHRHSHGGA
jgi:drug/metabolite transporter (DMT)-like permease